MNILLINGSPKGIGSNTYRLSKAFIDGIGDVSQTECTEVIVKDMDIKSCLGCFGCWKNGKGICDQDGPGMQSCLEEEGWMSPLSRQTQESALHVPQRHPRTAIGTTEQGDLVILVYSGRTKRSGGADYAQMLSVARKLYPELRQLMTTKLREYACELRTAHEAGEGPAELRARKDKMMETVYRMLCIALGKPPVRFTWETRDKDKNFIRIKDITPQEFFRQYIGWNLSDMVTVINAPTKDKPYGRTYTVRYLGNVRGGAYPVKYLNLPMDDLRDLTIRQLKDGRAVWFGSDVGQFSDRKGGYLTTDAYAVDELFSTEFPMTKEQRLDYGESLMTHAMVITGVDLDDEGRPIRWKVENSWGKDRGNDGFYVMSDEWFGEFSYQILLDRKYFTPEQAAAFDTEPIVLQPWDPMGSLATVEEQYGRSFRG